MNPDTPRQFHAENAFPAGPTIEDARSVLLAGRQAANICFEKSGI